MATNFVTNTASLKTTIADVRKLNAKKIFVGGENILDIINRATPTIAIKHANDTRTTVTLNDLWGQWVETKSDGTIIVHDDEVTNPNASNYSAWNTSISKVEDNAAYTGTGLFDDYGNLSAVALFANVQTNKIKNGKRMFVGCDNLNLFSSDLSSLTDGRHMFTWCSNLTTFTSDLSSLTYGERMFCYCENLESFSADLSSLTNGYLMFASCSQLNSFSSDSSSSTMNLSSLTNGLGMFQKCSNLTSFSADLSSLMNGEHMFYYCENLESFYSNLSSLTNGVNMFSHCSNLKSFSDDLSSLTNSDGMFSSCTQLTSFYSNLSSLTYSSGMFYYCSNLETFSSDLSSLFYGQGMFAGCSKLKSFTSDLSILTEASSMFSNCAKITSFNTDLPSLTYGSNVFYGCSNLTEFSSDLSSLSYGNGVFCYCSKLKSFKSDLSSLTIGSSMFLYCYKLTTFTSDLSSLTNGSNMFYGCSLDAESVMYIADTIKDITAEKELYENGTIPYVTEDRSGGWPYKYSAPRGFMSDGKYVYTYDKYDYDINYLKPYTNTISASNVGLLHLGINVSNNSSTIKQQLEDFAKAATFGTWSDLKKHFSDKGWTVTFQYGGTTTSIPNTYGLREGEHIIPCQIFAKLVEADKDSAEYCTEDASSFYNIEWGHDVTDTSSYSQFDSLEDAMASWNVFPKENIISTEE